MVFNKRITGHANLILRRGRVYRRDYLLAVLEAAAARADHVVVTGDITNLSLEGEYEEARALLDEVARSAEVTVVPGNHDIYLPAIHRERRFPHHFDVFLKSDLPQFARDLPAGHYPCVKLRGPAAIIALSSAVPRPPFVSAGYVGRDQLEALEEVLAHPEVSQRTPVLLIHHPPVDSRMRIARLRDGLVDAGSCAEGWPGCGAGSCSSATSMPACTCTLPTATGALDVVSASGAALDHPRGAVRAGFNLYGIDAHGGIASIEAFMIDADGRAMTQASILDRRSGV